MEVLKSFIEVCQRKPAILEDCVYSDFNDIAGVELFSLPLLLILSFTTTVYLLLRNVHGSRPLFHEILFHNPPSPIISESGDFNPMDEEPREEPWQYREDYPSPY